MIDIGKTEETLSILEDVATLVREGRLRLVRYSNEALRTEFADFGVSSQIAHGPREFTFVFIEQNPGDPK